MPDLATTLTIPMPDALIALAILIVIVELLGLALRAKIARRDANKGRTDA